jgi:hypothetical protein
MIPATLILELLDRQPWHQGGSRSGVRIHARKAGLELPGRSRGEIHRSIPRQRREGNQARVSIAANK